MDEAMYVPEEWKDKRFHYSWVLDDKKAQTVARFKGYEPVRTADESGSKFRSNRDPRASVDGLIRVGDCLLMRCAVDSYKKRKQDERRRAGQRMQAVKEEFHGNVASLGVPSFEDINKG